MSTLGKRRSAATRPGEGHREASEEMSSVNKVILVGNLGGIPDMKYTPAGKAVANFSIATSESWADKEGKRETRTEWHKIVAWNQLAELCGKFLDKGAKVYIEGKLQTRSYDKDGVTRYVTEVVASDIQFLTPKGAAAHDSGAAEEPHPTSPPSRRYPANARLVPAKPAAQDDDVPF